MSSTSGISQFANNNPWLTFGIVCTGLNTISYCVDAIFKRRDNEKPIQNTEQLLLALADNNARIQLALHGDNEISTKLQQKTAAYVRASARLERAIFEDKILKKPS